MKENKEENKIVEEGAVVINEKDIINPEEIKEEETIEVEAAEVIIEDAKQEEVTSTGETQEELKGESIEAPKTEDAATIETDPEKEKKEELVAKLNVYYDKQLKIDIEKGKVIREVYEENGKKLTATRAKELVNAGVAELQKI